MGLKSLFNSKKKDVIPSATLSQSKSLSVCLHACLALEIKQVFNKFDMNYDDKISTLELRMCYNLDVHEVQMDTYRPIILHMVHDASTLELWSRFHVSNFVCVFRLVDWEKNEKGIMY